MVLRNRVTRSMFSCGTLTIIRVRRVGSFLVMPLMASTDHLGDSPFRSHVDTAAAERWSLVLTCRAVLFSVCIYAVICVTPVVSVCRLAIVFFPVVSANICTDIRKATRLGPTTKSKTSRFLSQTAESTIYPLVEQLPGSEPVDPAIIIVDYLSA